MFTKPIYAFRVEGHRFDIIATTDGERVLQTLEAEPHVEVRVWEHIVFDRTMLNGVLN